MIVKLLIENHLEFLSLKGGCRGSSESTLVKMSNCWKSHVAAHIIFFQRMKRPDLYFYLVTAGMEASVFHQRMVQKFAYVRKVTHVFT